MELQKSYIYMTTDASQWVLVEFLTNGRDVTLSFLPFDSFRDLMSYMRGHRIDVLFSDVYCSFDDFWEKVGRSLC